MSRSALAGLWLHCTGTAALLLAAAVLVPLGEGALLVALLLGSFVLPALVSAAAAVLTGRALRRDPARSHVPAAAAAASLGASATFFAFWWPDLQPDSGLGGRRVLLAETVALAGIALASLWSLRLVLTRRSAGQVPHWATGAAWVTVGLVALLTGQLAAMSVPASPLEVSFPEQEREQTQTCRAARAVPAVPDPPGAALPQVPGAERVGGTVLPPAQDLAPVGTGLDTFAMSGGAVALAVYATEEDDDEDVERLVEEGLAAAGLSPDGVSSVTTNGDRQLYALNYRGAGRTGRIEVLDCGKETLLVVAEVLAAGRSGACAPPQLHARCDALLAATEQVRRRYGGQLPALEGGRLVLRLRAAELGPVSFVGQDVPQAFTSAGWRLTRSSCDDPCFFPDSPASFAFARPGLSATAVVTEVPGGDTSVVIDVVETR